MINLEVDVMDLIQLKLPIHPPEMDCPFLEGCEAPLCPMSPNLKHGVWFPGEPICRSKLFSNLRWLITQQEIARLPRKHERGYFTLGMLRTIRRVRPDLRGRND